MNRLRHLLICSLIVELLSLSLARVKSIYAVTHGLAPYFKSVLVSTLDKSDVHVYSLDEVLNDVTQTCEMDFYVRFWESVIELRPDTLVLVFLDTQLTKIFAVFLLM